MDEIMLRRSTRKYQDKAVEPEKLERILRAAMQSPTGRNSQEWEFIVVTDPETRKAVSELGPVSAFAADAPLQIAVCANMDKAWPGGNYGSWPGNLGAACQTMLIQIEREGLGACWIGVYPYADRMENLRRTLEIPENVTPFAVLAIGYKQFEKKFDDRFDPEKIHWGKY